MKKVIIPLFAITLLSGCINNAANLNYESIDYKTFNQKIIVYHNSEIQYQDVTIGEYENKVNNKEDFVILYYAESCSACEVAKNDYLNGYLSEKEFAIYQINIEILSKNELIRLSNVTANSKYRPYDDQGGGPYTPYLYFFVDGEVLVGEPHFTNFTTALDQLIEVSE